MCRLLSSRLAVVLAGAVLLAPVAFVAPVAGAAGKGRPGELLVVFAPGAARADAHSAAEAGSSRRLPYSGVEVVTVKDVDASLDGYRSRSDVRFAEENGTVVAAAAPNDEFYGRQWNMQPVSASNKGTSNAETAWSTATGLDVVVAVLDTGVRPGGGDLGGSGRLMAGYDFVNDDTDADDDDGHGTHVAGSIAQSTNNTQGFAGVAPRAKILPGKVLDENGSGDYATVIEGLVWATAQGAKVINLSLVGSSASSALCDAVATAAASAVVVAATGNTGGAVGYPAACSAALAVGAVRFDGQRPSYSNFGPGIDIVAPGGDGAVDQNADGLKDHIYQQSFSFVFGSIKVWEWQGRSGTSMATGHVSGAAALVEGLSPSSDARSVLLSTARDLGVAGPDDTYGSGALDAGAAVAAVPATNPSPLIGTAPTPAPPPPPGSGAPPPPPPSQPTGSYRFVASDGGIFSFGGAKFFGSMGGKKLSAPIVGMAATPTGSGYWFVGSDGGIFSFGDAKFFGSMGGKKLSAPVVGMASTPTGKGYWFVGSDGGIFSFGDAKFFGSMGGKKLSAPIVGMASTPTGKGYWFVGSDGGIFSFGDATFLGSMGGKSLVAPMVGMS